MTATVLYVKYPLSSYQVSEILEFFGMEIFLSNQGPLKIQSHLKKIAKNYKIKFSKVWHVDEKHTHKRGPSEKRKRGKRKWAYQITVLDSKGDVAASYLAPKRSTKAIRKVLKRAKGGRDSRQTSSREMGFPPMIKRLTCLVGGLKMFTLTLRRNSFLMMTASSR